MNKKEKKTVLALSAVVLVLGIAYLFFWLFSSRRAQPVVTDQPVVTKPIPVENRTRVNEYLLDYLGKKRAELRGTSTVATTTVPKTPPGQAVISPEVTKGLAGLKALEALHKKNQ